MILGAPLGRLNIFSLFEFEFREIVSNDAGILVIEEERLVGDDGFRKRSQGITSQPTKDVGQMPKWGGRTGPKNPKANPKKDPREDPKTKKGSGKK